MSMLIRAIARQIGSDETESKFSFSGKSPEGEEEAEENEADAQPADDQGRPA